jgi:hypothetical protein
VEQREIRRNGLLADSSVSLNSREASDSVVVSAENLAAELDADDQSDGGFAYLAARHGLG